MKSNIQIASSLVAALILTGCGAAEQRRAHYERSFPAAGIHRVEVREVTGSIWVEAGASNAVLLSADITARQAPDAKKDNDGYFTAQIAGDTLVIDTVGRRSHHGFFFRGPNVRANYKLRVPADVELVLQTVTGRISTRGIAGETIATTINGELDLEATGTNQLEAKAVNGRIEARFLNDFHGAHFKTVNGRVIATLPSSASFLGDFTQVNGDFEAAFPLNIHSHPGSRRVSGEVNGGRYALKITTVNGDIKIDNEPAPPVRPAIPEVPPAPKT